MEEDDDQRAGRDLMRPGGRAVPAPGQPSGERGGFPGQDLLASLAGLADPTEVVLRWYRMAANRIAYRLPHARRSDDAVIPGPSELWEDGDELADLDWTATITGSGVAIPGVTTRKRAWLPDDPRRGDRERPWIELYVDSSGSMPDPSQAVNPQVLAGFALVRTAVEAGGRVRVIQYSGPGTVHEMPEFTAASAPACRALLAYLGGGTDFPFAVLAASTARWRRVARVVRVVLSDGDFLANVNGGRATSLATLSAACAAGDRCVALLVATVPPPMRKLLEAAGVELVLARDRDQLLGLAEQLGRQLFPQAVA